MAQYPNNLEDERASSILQTITIPNYTKRLARKSSKEDIMFRNIVAFNLMNVSDRTNAEIVLVLRLRALVDVAGEGAAQP